MKTVVDISKTLPNIDQYIASMLTCPQDSMFHREGSVGVHTMLVLDEIEKIIVRENLSTDESEILRYAGFLHDIGKPLCSKMEDGHLRSHGHSRIGYHIALELLYTTNLSFDKIHTIAQLIKNHGRPPYVIECEDATKAVIETSYLTNNRLLYFLSEADLKGRISDDFDDLMVTLEYFKEKCEILNCFGTPYNFSDNHTKYIYFTRGTHYHTETVFDDYKSKVYLMSGLPGSGKDYYIKNNLSNIPIISLDGIRQEMKVKPTDKEGNGRVIQMAKERAKEYLRKNVDFIWNATNTVKSTREQLITLFDTYKAKTDIIFIYKPISEILKQNENRDAVVPENVIHKLLKKLDIPTQIECNEVIFV
jgi:predicted kinase